MPIISTPGYADLEPRLVIGYEASRALRTLVHESLDPGQPLSYVTLQEAGPRIGTLSLLFTNQDAAHECFNRHAKKLVHTFTHPLVHTMTMTYVTAGEDLTITLDPDTSKNWIVQIPFREVNT